MVFHYQIALIFTSSADVLEAVDNLSLLLAISILVNSVQPVLSGQFLILESLFHYFLYIFRFFNFDVSLTFAGVAVGSGWQAKVAFVNLGCYYAVGVPLGVVLGWVFNLGVEVGLFSLFPFDSSIDENIYIGPLATDCLNRRIRQAYNHTQNTHSNAQTLA